MPKIRRQNLPAALLHHLLDRIQQRNISASQLGLLAAWLDQQTDSQKPREAGDKYETLERLKHMLDEGILTQEEYEREKAKILNP